MSNSTFIDTFMPVSIRDSIRLEVIHPNRERLLFSSTVADHFNGVGFGVRFTDLNNEQDLFLQRVLRI
ncbi:MAG: hypothetical protein ACJ72Z_10800 [Pyrinomonadaceae bacterium]